MKGALSPGNLPGGWSKGARDGPLDQLLTWGGGMKFIETA